MIDFEKIIKSKKKGTLDRIHEALSEYKKFYLEYPIDWTEYECSQDCFIQFSIDKLSKSMAYGTETMSKKQAIDYLSQFLENFESDCRFFTNWDDVDIKVAEANGWSAVTKHTFDCSLIIIDKSKVGIILLIDED